MTDETPHKRTRRPRPSPAGGAPPASGQASPGTGDPDAALRRLESMGARGASGPEPAGAAPLPPDPVVDPFSGPPPVRRPGQVSGADRKPRVRPRPAGGPDSTRLVARIAAPVVFLVAVIALVGIVVQSGVMGADQPTPTPTVKPVKTKEGAVTKKYVVKSGDSLSSIATRFKTTTSNLQALNPDLSGSTLIVGERIVVPTQ